MPLSLMAAATPVFAEDTLSAGDTSWMIVATVLVIMMSIPGLALFYGGLVSQEHALCFDAGLRDHGGDVDSVGSRWLQPGVHRRTFQ